MPLAVQQAPPNPCAKAFNNKVRLPFPVRWGEHDLPAGEYDVIFMEAAPLPLIIVVGMDVVAMIAPSQVSACAKAQVNSLHLSPADEPPHVQLLHLSTLELDLRFGETAGPGAQPGILALPLRLEAQARSAAN